MGDRIGARVGAIHCQESIKGIFTKNKDGLDQVGIGQLMRQGQILDILYKVKYFSITNCTEGS